MKSPIASPARGFTLIEVLLVIALLTIAAGATLIIGTDSIGRSTARSERDLVVTLLQTARAEAMANTDEVPHGLHVGSDAYFLFKGASYVSSDPTNRSYVKEDAVLVSGPTDIVFEQLSGSVTTGGGTLLFTDSGQTASTSVNAEGRIDW
jgi:prepilin-type N-terminal cleavage/methylation domain-containing protein